MFEAGKMPPEKVGRKGRVPPVQARTGKADPHRPPAEPSFQTAVLLQRKKSLFSRIRMNLIFNQ